MIFPDSFQVFRKNKNKNGGCVFIAVKNDITISHEVAFDTDCEVKSAKLHFHQPVFILQNSQQCNSRPCSPRSSIQKIIANRRLPHVIMAGDFNQPDIDWLNNTS